MTHLGSHSKLLVDPHPASIHDSSALRAFHSFIHPFIYSLTHSFIQQTQLWARGWCRTTCPGKAHELGERHGDTTAPPCQVSKVGTLPRECLGQQEHLPTLRKIFN